MKKIIQTNKYKDVNLYLRFTEHYTKKRKSILYLVSKMFGDTSKSYPSKLDMTRAKDMLYGIDTYCGLKGRGGLLTVNINFSFINPKFLKDVTFEEYSSFIQEILFNTVFDEKNLEEAKRNLSDNIARSLDKPGRYAANRVTELLSENCTEFEIYDINLIEEISKVTLEEIREEYDKMLHHYQLDIYCVGDIDNNEFSFTEKLEEEERIKVGVINTSSNVPEREDIIEEKEISQSYLQVIYKTPYNSGSKDFYKWVMGNVFLGLVPTSLLFEEVREKLSLCYTISLFDYKNEGVVRIYTDIDADKKDETLREIRRQVERIANKDFDLEKFEISRKLFMGTIKSVNDDLNSLIDFYHSFALRGEDVSLEEYIKNIEKVSAEDIAEIFRNYTYCFSYMLKGVVENGEDL